MFVRLRAVAFYAGFVVLTGAYSLVALCILAMPLRRRIRVMRGWAVANLAWLGICCRLYWRVRGLENIPTVPAVVVANHQSTWETLAIAHCFPPLTWILKRELLRIPVFGQALASINPIAIDRKRATSALKQVTEIGSQRLRDGLSVIIFPEGTRTRLGESRRFSRSAALLARETGCPIVPVAHNAGHFWTPGKWVKRPGVIDMVIGTPISPEGKSVAALTDAYTAWIEHTCGELGRGESGTGSG